MKARLSCTGHTKVYGVLGWPIEHTFSPFMQQAAFQACGMDAVYVPFSVPPDKLKEALAGVRALGIQGVNVTIPHKKAVIPYLDGIRGAAIKIGAVNVISNEKGLLIGYNTDAEGFLASLQRDTGFDVHGSCGVLLGAGGAGEAVAAALAGAGIKSLTVVDSIRHRAINLVRKMSRKYPRTRMQSLPIKGRSNIRAIQNASLLVNASPVGMDLRDESPVDPSLLHQGQTVYDLVYQHETRLLKLAKKKGCRVCGGLGMLLFQGARSFEIWTDRRAPLLVMESALKKAILGF